MGFRRVVASAVMFVLLSAATPTIAAPPPKKQAAGQVAKPTVPPDAAKLIDDAVAAGKAQKFPAAVDLLGQAIVIIEKKFGKDHYLLGNALNLLAQIEMIQGHFDIAEKHAERSIGILRKDVNADPLRLGHALIRRAELYGHRGLGDEEIKTRRSVVDLLQRAFGPESIDAMAQVLGLARALSRLGRYAEAQVQFEHWLRVVERAVGPNDPGLVDILIDSATNEIRAGHYQEAEGLLTKALEIRKKQGRSHDEDVAVILNNLAEIEYQRGAYLKAEALYTRVLAVYENEPYVDPQSLGIILGNLGSVRLDLGRTNDGLKLLRRSLEIHEKHLDPNDAELATPLTNLGEALLRTGQLSESIPYLERALKLREKAFGEGHPRLVTPLINLGAARLDEGKLAEAEAHLLHAERIQEKTAGRAHPLMFQIHQAMGILEQKRKRYSRAEDRHLAAFDVIEKAFGPTHPNLVAPLKSLAVLDTLRKDFAAARRKLEQAGDIAEQHTKLLLAVGAEPEKLAWLSTIEPLWSLTLEHHVRREPTNPAAARLALEAMLRRKGRALDAVVMNMSALRRRLSAEDQDLFDALQDKQRKFAGIASKGIPYGPEGAQLAATLKDLGREIDRLQRQMNERGAARVVETAPVTISALQANLPKDAAYVEIVCHHMGWAILPGEEATWQYTAYVVKPEGDPEFVALGHPEDIEPAITQLREALGDPAREDVVRLSRALDEKIMRPIRARLGSARRLIIAPERALNFIPFEVFVDEQGHYAVENYSISYVTSARDVFRWPMHYPSRSAPVIVANPDFGELPRKSGQASTNQHRFSTGIGKLAFPPLPGTAEEGKTIAARLSGAALYTEKQATKLSVMAVAGPKILHIATHGFFRDNSTAGASGGTRGFTLEPAPPQPRATVARGDWQAPAVLRSGLAFAGANSRDIAESTHVLTGLEAGGLDLEGTKLVVLSACETGLGDFHRAEGVLGLRRAFAIAGAETVVMSLWPVDDRATRDMMIGYYQRLEKGGGRSDSLRDARLQLLANEKTAHPFYWASFIVSGDPTRLDGSMPSVPIVPPSARGCACTFVGDVPSRDVHRMAWLFMVSLVVGACRRRRLS